MFDDEIPPMVQQMIVKQIRERKPYWLEMEEKVQALGFGSLDLKVTVRAGEVTGIDFFVTKKWLNPRHIEGTVAITG